jgi:hypothetical protein
VAEVEGQPSAGPVRILPKRPRSEPLGRDDIDSKRGFYGINYRIASMGARRAALIAG